MLPAVSPPARNPGPLPPGGHRVQVSPRHAVTIDGDYFSLVQRAPEQDFVVRTLVRTMAGDTPLMVGELVIAGQRTRERHPLAAVYPLHFRKTYFPGRLRGDTEVEFERHARASEVLDIPPPIGRAGGTFRTCLLPGRPLHEVVLPFGSDPEESNLRHADAMSLATAGGVWSFVERAVAALLTLHRAGITHGDAQLHNFIVCYAPVEVIPIDFDMSVAREAVGEEAWRAECDRDLEQLLKIAVFVQCALGAQPGELGGLSLARMDTLFERSEPFRRAIADRASLLATTLRTT